MWVYLWNRLPSEYQEVEYIQSSWQNNTNWQYINTGITPNSTNTTVKLKVTPTSSSYSVYVCGVLSASNGYYYWLSFTANRWHCGSGTSWSSWSWRPIIDFSYTWNWGNWIYDVEYKNDDCYINNTLVADASSNTTSFSYPMFLFARNNYGSVGGCSSFKLYSCQIYQSGDLLRDFVPCYRKSDSVIWLYDLVNNQFYTNSWTGTFSKGNDVTMAELKNAYIGEYKEITETYTVTDASNNTQSVSLYKAWYKIKSVTLSTTASNSAQWANYDIRIRDGLTGSDYFIFWSWVGGNETSSKTYKLAFSNWSETDLWTSTWYWYAYTTINIVDTIYSDWTWNSQYWEHNNSWDFSSNTSAMTVLNSLFTSQNVVWYFRTNNSGAKLANNTITVTYEPN